MAENGAHFSGEGHLIEGEIEGHPNKEVRSIVCDEDGHLIIDLDASTITIGTVDQGASGTDPWLVKIDQTGTNNNVDANVTNFPASQAVTEANVDSNFGTWSYYAGTSGTVSVTAGQRVIGIGVHATTAGSLTINGGATIPVPAGVGISINPLANVVAPTIIFTGTDSYFVEVVI